jgi:putative phage-type endonuclease
VTSVETRQVAPIPLQVRQGTPEWLDTRLDGIARSDLPIITGSKPGSSVTELWAIKLRLVEPPPPDDATAEMWELGHALEPIIADAYTHKTGRSLRRVNRMLSHAEHSWAFASLDRVAVGERRIVELKWAPHRRWVDGPEPVPPDVADQVQWQLLVTGYPVADVAVLTGSRVEIHELEADRGYQDDLLFLARDFRQHVLEGTRPPVDGSEATRRALARLHPREAGTILAPSLEMDAIALQLRDAKAAAKDAADQQATLENAIRALLGDAPGVEGDGYRISWTRNADSERTDWKAVAAGYRELLEPTTEADQLDAIASLHTATVEGPRVLRTRFRNEEGKWT